MRRLQRRGFTLIELMVTIAVSAIVIIGIYTLYSVSVTGYRIQDQTLDAQGQLRQAMLQLKADLRAAGYNAPAQSDVEPWVRAVGTTTLAAFTVQPQNPAPVANSGVNENIAPQMVDLLGDFESHRQYRTVLIAGDTVTIQWSPEYGDEQEFQRLFRPGNLVRIELYGVAREEQVIEIVANDPGDMIQPSITLEGDVQNVQGFGSGHELTVMSWYRYRLQLDTRRNSDNSVKFDLVREQLNGDGLPIDNTMLVVAENIVDLQVYDLCFNRTLPDPGTWTQVPVDLACFPTVEAANASVDFAVGPGANNSSHNLRAVTVKISARTPFEDPDVPFAPKPELNHPMRAYDLDPDLQGAARVFEMAATIMMTGIQSRRQ